jgi:hypothetical protein
MKTLLGLLIWVCVGVGAVSAVTAYFPPTTLDPEKFRSDNPEKRGDKGYLKLSDPVGPKGDDGKRQFPAGTELTSEVLARMSELQPDGRPLVRRVHVGEFSFSRWSHAGWFIASAIALALCGVGQRMLANGGVVKKGAADPVKSLDSAIAELAAIHEALRSGGREHGLLHTIVHRVGELQQTHLANFAEARDVLVSRHGMGRFAEIMDAFAGAERKINRAWSAAADGVLGEAVDSLEAAAPMLEEARKRMQ